jgi:hypothetical protein
MAHRDFWRFYSRLRPGGLFVMDGYNAQVGPTEAVDSLSAQYTFTALPYQEHSCHAVHYKPKASLKTKDSNLAVCDECGTSTACKNWREADKSAKEHTISRGHSVRVHIASRDLSYMMIPKGAM